MFIRIIDDEGDMRLVNTDKIAYVCVSQQTKSHVSIEPEIDSFYSMESVTDIDQKLYRAGLISN